MAEFLFKDMISSNEETWHIASAGTWAIEGAEAARHVKTVLAERDLEASSHRSQPVTRDLLKSFNLVLVMEKGHKEALRVEFPEHRSKVYLLSEMVGSNRDIYDPIGGPLIDFQDTAAEIDDYLQRGLERITVLAGVK